MGQYIDKSILVTELNRLKECNRQICGGDFDFLKKSYPEHYYSTKIYDDILSFLDTHEAKDVDKEKESLTWEDIWKLYIIFAEVDAEIEFSKIDIKPETIGYYKEVLKRFKS